MAIAPDSVSSSGTTSTSAGSLTWSHTCTGTNLVLMVGVTTGPVGNVISSVTYNGVAMTLGHSSTTDYFRGWYYLVNPPTGAHNIVVTWSSTPGNEVNAGGISFTDAYQGASPIDGTSVTNGGSSVASSVTTAYNNTYVIDLFVDNSVAETPTPNAGQTQIWLLKNSRIGGSSRKQQVTAGACSMDWTGATAYRDAIAVGVREYSVNSSGFFNFF